VKGADQCPKCGSRKSRTVSQALTKFYAADIRVCANCSTAWEPFDPKELLDVDMPKTSSFLHPCGNCAFRKGSPEQNDPVRWAELRGELEIGHRFYCHKGVPVTPESEHGFDYPDGGKTPSKLRLCRGYLNQLKLPKFEEAE
jgi:hypothetical protein